MANRPWKSGKFLISAGLKPLGERPVFETEPELEKYLFNKAVSRQENLLKYYPLPFGLDENEMLQVVSYLQLHLKNDLPERNFDQDVLDARDEIDRVISQVPEDFAIWKMDNEQDWMALIHVCSPNHWDPRKKMAKSFLESHETIPHIEPVSRAAPKIFKQIQNNGAFERFAWGVSTDQRLNHHTEAPIGADPDEWRGRSFNPFVPILYIRQERQTLFPITEQMIGFTIKTSFINVRELSAEDLALVHQSIKGMDEMILKYKGLLTDKEAILRWLEHLALSSMSTVNLPPHDVPQAEQYL